jgi:tRNA pseudouridine65 synthase
VVGDATFGKGIHNRFVAGRVGMTRLWLHAWSLAFTHPRSRALMRVEAPLTGEWARILAWPGWHEDPPADEDAGQALAAVRAAHGRVVLADMAKSFAGHARDRTPDS